jgi:hypothetical protein
MTSFLYTQSHPAYFYVHRVILARSKIDVDIHSSHLSHTYSYAEITYRIFILIVMSFEKLSEFLFDCSDDPFLDHSQFDKDLIDILISAGATINNGILTFIAKLPEDYAIESPVETKQHEPVTEPIPIKIVETKQSEPIAIIEAKQPIVGIPITKGKTGWDLFRAEQLLILQADKSIQGKDRMPRISALWANKDTKKIYNDRAKSAPVA